MPGKLDTIYYLHTVKNKIPYIVTAHHSDDQIETFLIRLSRGSGLQGLSSMSEISKLKNDIKIFRPFLSFQKNQLVRITKVIFKNFVKDPSNHNKKFLRTKIRRLVKTLNNMGIEVSTNLTLYKKYFFFK